MELLGDNLETYLFRQNGTLTISQVSQIAVRVLSVLKQVHSRSFMTLLHSVLSSGRYLLHRDIKPRNIVLASNRIDQNFDDLYLIDFGLSKFYVTPEPSSEQRSSSPQRSHIPFDDHRIHGNFTGSPRFASVSVLIGYGWSFPLLVTFFDLIR
jgi:serine/threonine protein kinase